MTIYITGDTHGGIDESKLYSRYFKDSKKCTKEDYLIILGDWGYIFEYNPSDIESDENFSEVDKLHIRKKLISERKLLNYMFTDKKYTTLVILGNHENYDRVKKFPIIDKFGGKVRKINDSIFILMRGEVYTIDGYKFFTFGGAKSIDKGFRTEGISWWREEECTLEEEKYAIENLQKHGNKIDFILTHTCAESTLNELFQMNYISSRQYDKQNIFLEKIKQNIDYKYWFLGHMHKDCRINEKEFVVFNKVLKLEDIQNEDRKNPYKRFSFFNNN